MLKKFKIISFETTKTKTMMGFKMDANNRFKTYARKNKKLFFSRLSASALGVVLGIYSQLAAAGPTGGEV